MRPTEVFLSHSSHDHDMAERVVLTLRDHGVPAFFSPANILGAQQWQDEILQALERCDWFLVLLSPEAVESMWVKREVAYALADRRYENKIAPLNHRACDWGSLRWLKIFQVVDVQGDFRDSMRELLRIWGIGLKA